MGRLIDADKLRYKHSLNTVNTTMPQSFPCITKDEINNAPTVEAIPKEQYEARLKADMVTMLTELLSDVEKMSNTIVEGRTTTVISWVGMQKKICNLIQQKINELRGKQDE